MGPENGDGQTRRIRAARGLPPNSRRARKDGIRVESIPVERIRPEEGLGRRRDRDGHRELRDSIAEFGVLTPITVRKAGDGSDDYLLVKGQGRTLACRMLGLKTIPAIVFEADFADTQKVQQFLVENVARLRMRPIDRALLIAHAASGGEETAVTAKRFGISAATVRRLKAQLEGATSGEVAALRAGTVTVAVHAAISRHVRPDEREAVIRVIDGLGLRSKDLESLFVALGWRRLVELGPGARAARLRLLRWAAATLASLPRGEPRERMRQLAIRLPLALPSEDSAEFINEGR